MEFTLLWAALTGVALLWVGTRVWGDGLPDRPFDAAIGAAMAGLAAGRLTAMLAQGVNPITNPADILIVRGGVHTGAAATATLLTLVWQHRRRPGVLDSYAPAALLGLAGWHVGCLWRGACLGAASDLPWAWSGPMTDITRHPVEIYAAVGLALAAWLVARLRATPFLASGAALSLAGLVRLVTEPTRPSLGGGPVEWYWAAVVVGLILASSGRRLWERLPRAAST